MRCVLWLVERRGAATEGWGGGRGGRERGREEVGREWGEGREGGSGGRAGRGCRQPLPSAGRRAGPQTVWAGLRLAGPAAPPASLRSAAGQYTDPAARARCPVRRLPAPLHISPLPSPPPAPPPSLRSACLPLLPNPAQRGPPPGAARVPLRTTRAARRRGGPGTCCCASMSRTRAASSGVRLPPSHTLTPCPPARRVNTRGAPGAQGGRGAHRGSRGASRRRRRRVSWREPRCARVRARAFVRVRHVRACVRARVCAAR